MVRLLGILVLVIMVILAVPTGLVLASQQAIPGDTMYPVKRGLENGIIKIASLNPTTSAFFKLDLTKRRYQEATTLFARGQDKNADASLTELVTQAQQAAQQINQVQDPERKKQLVAELVSQINTFDRGLSQIEQSKNIAQAPVSTPTPTVEPAPIQSVPTIQPTAVPTSMGVLPSPVVTPIPTATPRPTTTPRPTSTAQPTPTNRPTPVPTQPPITPINPGGNCQGLPPIQKTRCELQHIVNISKAAGVENRPASKKQDKKEEKKSASTPSPIPTPVSTPRPSSTGGQNSGTGVGQI